MKSPDSKENLKETKNVQTSGSSNNTTSVSYKTKKVKEQVTNQRTQREAKLNAKAKIKMLNILNRLLDTP